jgi:hypothetical protein
MSASSKPFDQDELSREFARAASSESQLGRRSERLSRRLDKDSSRPQDMFRESMMP